MSHLIQIGNSHGVRIPKTLIEQAGLLDAELTFKVVAEGLLITPSSRPRNGWEEAFKTAEAKEPDDLSIMQNIQNKFDTEEWEW